jgi:hypothetical protein
MRRGPLLFLVLLTLFLVGCATRYDWEEMRFQGDGYHLKMPEARLVPRIEDEWIFFRSPGGRGKSYFVRQMRAEDELEGWKRVMREQGLYVTVTAKERVTFQGRPALRVEADLVAKQRGRERTVSVLVVRQAKGYFLALGCEAGARSGVSRQEIQMGLRALEEQVVLKEPLLADAVGTVTAE